MLFCAGLQNAITGGELIVDQTALPKVAISGFKAGDKIERLDAAAAGTVKVTKANEVTVSAGGKTYELNIAGAKEGETKFKFSDHTLTETTAKMAIQRPVVSPADAASALPYLAAAGGYQAALAPAAYTHWAASAAPYAGFRDGLIQVPHGGAQIIVTLQSG